MKNIKNMLFAAVALVVAFAFSSCTDGNDWGTDKSYDRVFTPSSVSISTSAGVSTITWSTYDPADEYLIEITNYGKELTNDVEPGSLASDLIYDKVFTAPGYVDGTKMSSFVLPEKLPTGMYQLRLKAISKNGRGESKWCKFTKENDIFFEIGGGESEEE